MLIVCPNCTTSYDVDGAKLGAGRSVRCAKCRTEWFATPAETAHAGAALNFGAPPPVDQEAADRALAEEWAAAAAEPAAEVPQTVHDAPPLSPAGMHGEIEPPAQPDADPHNEDVETAAARGAQILRVNRPARRARRRQTLAFAIIAMALILGAIVGLRTEVVRLLPQTALAYEAIGLPVNLRGLVFANVKTAEETQDGVPVLLVEGEIVNVVKKIVPVPRLRFSVRNKAGVEIYAWTSHPSQGSLGRDERLAFRSRLASPPAEMHDVQVRFFHRRDLERGT